MPSDDWLTTFQMFKALICISIVLVSVTAGSSQSAAGLDLVDFVSQRLNTANETEGKAGAKRSFADICAIGKSVAARRVFAEYGSIFAADNVELPPSCIFPDDAAVFAFQSRIARTTVNVDGAPVLLQKAAAESLVGLLAEASEMKLRVRPFDGGIAGGRTYAETVRLWKSRFEPALAYWTKRGRIPFDQGEAVRNGSTAVQIEKVIEWEAAGMWFGLSRRASIFSSTAPPGASQHLALLAFDVTPPISPAIRALFNSHGWYQTVKGDPPHFTYLGVAETELPMRGLHAVRIGDTQYWVPNLADVMLP